MNKKLVLSLCLLLIVLTLGFIKLGEKKQLNSVHLNNQTQETAGSVEAIDLQQSTDSKRKKQKFETVGECRQLSNEFEKFKTSEIKKLRKKFDKKSSWDVFLEQGYSIEEVAYLVEFIKRGRWAENWVHDKRRAQSLVAQSKLKKDKEFLDVLQSNFSEEKINSIREVGFILERLPTFPQEKLKDLRHYSTEQQNNLIRASNVDLNDIAYHMRYPSVDDETIILMLDQLDDSDKFVYYNGISSINILDYALAAARPELYQYLLTKDFKPSDDAYLNNTLEWALLGLQSILDFRERPLSQENELKVEKLVAITRDLNSQRFTVDYKRGRTGTYYARSKAGYWSISAKSANELIDRYSFSLDTLNQTNQGDIDSSKSLANLYEENIKKGFFEKKTVANIDVIKTFCDAKLDDIQARRNELKKNAYQEIDRIKKLYNNDSIAIEKHLAQIDPSLVDAFRRAKPYTIQWPEAVQPEDFSTEKIGKAIFDSANNIDNLMNSNKEEIIALFKSSEFKQKDHQILTDFLCDKPHLSKWLDKLLDEGLTPENIRRCNLLNININALYELSNREVDINFKDRIGKDIFFKAVVSNKLDLVKMLISIKLEKYNVVDISMDSLDYMLAKIAFDYSGSDFKSSDEYKMLSLLMTESVKIDSHHKLRLALIKMNHPKEYKELIESFPSLTIANEQQLPKYLYLH